VVVEAPKNGDPIYTLRKEFEGGRDGDVFVRKSGRTERANSADLKALVERAAAVGAATPDLEVSLVGDVPLSWFDPTTIDSIVAAWVGDRRRAMESAGRAEERLARMFRDATRMASIPGLADEPDKRTLDEYLAEVDAWGAQRARVRLSSSTATSRPATGWSPSASTTRAVGICPRSW
jgi:hypothetical protein